MSLKISKSHIVTLWHETQMGNIHTCREKQLEFSDMMWELYEDMQPEVFDADKDCFSYHEKQDHKAMKREKK